jgi:hypothetical protein
MLISFSRTNGKARVDIVNFVAPHMIYNSLTIYEKDGKTYKTEKFDKKESTYLCMVRAFALAVHERKEQVIVSSFTSICVLSLILS